MTKQDTLPQLPKGHCASEWGGRETGPCLYLADEVHTYAAVSMLDALAAQVPQQAQGVAAPAFSTSKAGRDQVARFFSEHLKRHDFTRYISDALAADFACALAPVLYSVQAAAPQAAPAPAPQALTDEQLRKIHHEDEFGLFCDFDEFEQIARAIEQAHGIGAASAGGGDESSARKRD